MKLYKGMGTLAEKQGVLARIKPYLGDKAFYRQVVAYPEFQQVYQSDNLLFIGATRKNVQGYDIPIFDMERSVCDAIKYRNKVGIDVMTEILQTYLRHPDKNISRLMDYASKLRIRKTLNQYIEVWQ